MFTTTKSWSKQVLVKYEYRKGEEVHTENALIVCNQGLDLFQKEFIDGKFEGQNQLAIPFDIIVLGGHPCPRGKFYEVEYTIGGNTGLMHRALIQAVDPVTDLPLVMGALMHKGHVHSFIVTHKAYLRDDIDAVRIVSCSRDKDLNDTCIYGSHVTPREEQYSILDKVQGKDPAFPNFGAVCLELYQSDHSQEVWIDLKLDKFETKPIFVCGSSNVFDPAFKEQRDEDLAELLDHINEASQLAQEYGLQHLFCYETGVKHPDTGAPAVNLMYSCTNEFATATAKFIEQKNEQKSI